MTRHLTILALLSLAACSSSKGPDKAPELTPEMIARHYERVLSRMDTNGDDQITCADTEQMRRDQFHLLDEDKDGRLTDREYRGAQFEDKAFMFYSTKELDKNENGTLSPGEFLQVADNILLSMDSDEDCIISPQEAAASEHKKRLMNARGRREERRPQRKPGEGVDPF